MTHSTPESAPLSVELVGESRWGNAVTRSSKAVAAFLVPAVSLGGTLGALLPAAQAAPITAAVAAATSFLVWLTANAPKIADVADSTEEFIEGITGHDV